MLEYEGKYGTAKVMIDDIDQATVSQIYEFLNHEAFTNPIAIMPDCHKGNGAVIGFTMEMGDYWFTVHSGSRQFGMKICQYWQRKAGKGQMAYLQGDDMFGYLTDMLFAQNYAELNRKSMAEKILSVCNISPPDVKQTIETNHNFIDFDDFIIRKGAIKSYIGDYMIIPFNMEDGILICSGRSNPEWNYSAPHGAGRVGSRTWAKKNLNLEEAKHRMETQKIFCSSLPTDELKGAYKDPKIIETAIEPTAGIVDRIKPVLSMKG